MGEHIDHRLVARLEVDNTFWTDNNLAGKRISVDEATDAFPYLRKFHESLFPGVRIIVDLTFRRVGLQIISAGA